MKLPTFFDGKKTINLLPRDAFESSSLGVVLTWALQFGKWAVIITQLLVMIAFLWRFGLDRKLTDMRKQAAQEVAVIESYKQIEDEFVNVQTRVVAASKVLANEELISDSWTMMEQYTPADVWYEQLSFNPSHIAIRAYASSLNGFSRLISKLQADPNITSINVSSIEDAKGEAAIKFAINLTLKGGSK